MYDNTCTMVKTDLPMLSWSNESHPKTGPLEAKSTTSRAHARYSIPVPPRQGRSDTCTHVLMYMYLWQGNPTTGRYTETLHDRSDKLQMMKVCAVLACAYTCRGNIHHIE